MHRLPVRAATVVVSAALMLGGCSIEPAAAPTPSPDDPRATSSRATPASPSSGGFPSVDSTGPRVSVAQMSTHTGNLSTSADGQVIERMVINGNLTIRHNNVIVRDVLIRGVGRYMVHVDNVDARCPSNVKVEYTEVDGSRVGPNQIPVYAECGATFDHLYVHGSGRGIRLVSNSVVSNSFVIAHRHEGGMHRTAIGHNGGSNNTVYHNTLYCEGTNCSSAVSSYGDFAQVDGFRLENNLLATTAYYCVYGGSGPVGGSNAFPHGSNVKIINNHFSTIYAADCGQSAPINTASFANGVRGNECHGNVWHESRMSADTACGPKR